MSPERPSQTTSARNPPRRVVFVAFSCEPYRGSEPGVGWNFVHELAQSQPVWVVTHESHREPIGSYLKKFPTPFPIEATYVSVPGIEWMRLRSYIAFNLYYYLWQFAAARALRALHRQHAFEIVQHISLMRWWMATAATTLAARGVKFVWGPIGAGELMDRRFTRSIGWRNRLLETARNVARWVWLRDPGFRRTVRLADVALASTYESAQRLRDVGVRNVAMMSGVAMNIPPETLAIRRNRPQERFRFISGGGLIYWKRYDLIVRAFAKAHLSNAEYVHVCGGYELENLNRLANELGVADRVKFPGEMPYTRCVEELAKSDAMVHPVLRDSAGIIVEAMTLGLPVLTFDHLSPGYLVPDDAGHKVPLRDGMTAEQLVDEFAAVMRRWVDDRALMSRLSAAARRQGEALSRPARNQALLKLYETVCTRPTAALTAPAVHRTGTARAA